MQENPNVEYIYSKPFGFQRIQKQKSKVECQGQHHDFTQTEAVSPASNYNMTEFLRFSSDSEQEFDEVMPEFVGSVAISHTSQRGRGLFVTEDIAAGELLLASKALAIVFPTTESTSSSRLWQEVQKLGKLRQELGNLIRTNSLKAAQVYHLYAGPLLGYLDPPVPPVDSPEVDTDRIERICSFNAFQSHSSNASIGLWYYPSFVNHDCLGANARWTIIKNFMFVRALRPIKKDSEVLISYVDPNDSTAFRRNFFLKHEFFCTCALCCTERGESQYVRRRREIIMEDFRSNLEADEIGEIDDVIEELDELRPISKHLNVFLIQPLLAGGLSHYEKGHYEQALPYFLRAFDLSSISSQLSLLCVSCAFTIATCFLRRNKLTLATQWVDISKKWVVNIYGTIDVIEILRPTFLKEMTQCGLLTK